MELRMPVGYPGAAVGGGDALDGPGFFALNAVQQIALYAFWTAPGWQRHQYIGVCTDEQQRPSQPPILNRCPST